MELRSTFFTSTNVFFEAQTYVNRNAPHVPIVLAAPAPLASTGPVLLSGAMAIYSSRVNDPSTWALQNPLQQSYFVKSARLFSNFADGLFPKHTFDFWVWFGDPVSVIPFSMDRYLLLGFTDLNEWQTVNKPLPKNPFAGGSGAVCFKTNSGIWDLLTLSINPLYNGEVVDISLQLEICTSAE